MLKVEGVFPPPFHLAALVSGAGLLTRGKVTHEMRQYAL